MMVRQVPFDSTGDPGAEQADQRGFDDMLVVDEVITVRLVDRFEDLATKLGKNADLDVLIFEIDHGIGLVFLLRGQVVVDRIRVDAVLRALRVAAEVELWVGVRGANQVGRDGDLFFPGFNGRCCGKQRRSCRENQRNREDRLAHSPLHGYSPNI